MTSNKILPPKHQRLYAQDQSSAVLMRNARKPYVMGNLITGGVLLAFVASAYWYSIKAVSQDDFSDVPLPAGAGKQAPAGNGN
ncbi:hypothetical protein SAICODRAFT_19861 [Saitoella complicata NRRL Y-17804]|uniref:uncharacterized protein n=1 Tax=Saitoella complicata (strain BCRC 22490 / CBS 7301 / JCM 7358 / NBRC 10748 / NRRL Y-17804) TaxID=698492 RepID=UPI0008672355|nr:uncharacterized protein SAICODRAFT_19861 [Saitoella complicata NRRL Y-17804]ODQ52289.1 hypothetical protein SAICODRAFT_19861 [Saitoella complicata NRRL Y-17804]